MTDTSVNCAEGSSTAVAFRTPASDSIRVQPALDTVGKIVRSRESPATRSIQPRIIRRYILPSPTSEEMAQLWDLGQ